MISNFTSIEELVSSGPFPVKPMLPRILFKIMDLRFDNSSTHNSGCIGNYRACAAPREPAVRFTELETRCCEARLPGGSPPTRKKQTNFLMSTTPVRSQHLGTRVQVQSLGPPN
jgi:hypothetical protein